MSAKTDKITRMQEHIDGQNVEITDLKEQLSQLRKEISNAKAKIMNLQRKEDAARQFE